MDIQNTCCFTGHRQIPFELISDINDNLDIEINWLVSHGIRTFYTGGALGFDLLAGRAVLRAKASGSDIRLIIAVPCPDQERYYPNWDRVEYRRQLLQADEVVRVSGYYYKGCMLARDRYMVDRSAYCVSWQTTDRGGTAYTVAYALKKGRRVINLADRQPDDNDLGRDFEGKIEKIHFE